MNKGTLCQWAGCCPCTRTGFSNHTGRCLSVSRVRGLSQILNTGYTVFEGHLAQFVNLWNQIENFKVLCLWNGAFGYFYELFFECSCSLAKTQLAFYKKMKFNLYFLICAICTAVTSIKKNQFLSCGCYCSCRFLLHFFLSSLKSYSTNQIQFNTKVYGSGSDIFLV